MTENNNLCIGCREPVHVLPGSPPFQYDHETGSVWHLDCLYEREFTFYYDLYSGVKGVLNTLKDNVKVEG